MFQLFAFAACACHPCRGTPTLAALIVLGGVCAAFLCVGLAIYCRERRRRLTLESAGEACDDQRGGCRPRQGAASCPRFYGDGAKNAL